MGNFFPNIDKFPKNAIFMPPPPDLGPTLHAKLADTDLPANSYTCTHKKALLCSRAMRFVFHCRFRGGTCDRYRLLLIAAYQERSTFIRRAGLIPHQVRPRRADYASGRAEVND